jgi:branched-chain amino acid transport system substrate-binding protein
MRLLVQTLLVAGILLARTNVAATVSIGVFAPKDTESGVAVRHGAHIAVERANAAEPTTRFRLVEAVADARWGAASRELTRLIYTEDVVGIVGATDGRSAHLAEQIITRAKGKAFFIVSWTSDATLTRINIPWFFSVLPDDYAQALMVERAIIAARLARVAVVAEAQYDARMAFQAIAARFVTSPLTTVRFEGSAKGVALAVASCRKARPEAVVLLAEPATAERFVRAFRQSGQKAPIFVTLRLACDAFLRAVPPKSNDVRVPTPFDRATKAFRDFARRYRAKFGAEPSVAAAYAYDATTAIAQAVRAVGSDPARLPDAISRVSFVGATGPVRFAANRGRLDAR